MIMHLRSPYHYWGYDAENSLEQRNRTAPDTVCVTPPGNPLELVGKMDAGLITQLFLVEKPELPLSGFADQTYFKVYMSDLGPLRAKSGLTQETILNETDLYSRYKGAFAENYVLNELRSIAKDPYFWRSSNTAEVDFIFEEKASLIPVEVKAADNTQAKSYKQFCKKYSPAFGFKLSEKNIAVNMYEQTETCSLPLYITWNMDFYIRQEHRSAGIVSVV